MFVELKCKTHFSFLSGASSAQEYVIRAKEMEMPALGFCDINGVYSLPRALEAAQKYYPELKIITGAEITIKDYAPITLLAKSRAGYGLLCRLLTALHGGKEKGEGFLTFHEISKIIDQFPDRRSELICLTSVDDLATSQEKVPLALIATLFPQNTFLTLCRYLDGLHDEQTERTLEQSLKFNLPIVATNNPFYHIKERKLLQGALTSIREGVTIDDAGFKLHGNDKRYLKSDLQMQALFSDLPEAIKNTELIAGRCHFSLTELKYTYPKEFVPEGHTARSYLKQEVYKCAREVYRNVISDEVDRQLKRELDFFAKYNHEAYFLTVYDIIKFAKEKNIFCQGRGSAANSLVCYVLGITSVDPIHMGLLFDRFMNEGRLEPPDIDVDFEHDRREEVIQYIYERFGRDRAAMVAAVRTYRTRSAFIEISKALGVKVGTLSADALDSKFDELAGELKFRRSKISEMIQDLKSFPRHLSIHSGGFLLSDEPLVEICPIEPARMLGRTIIQWDKDDLETLQLMKLDILSIGFLTALHHACDFAGISWRDIPADCTATYEMIQKAETHGTFQIESRAQMNNLVRTLPENFYHLVVQVAIVRPSPSEGGMVQPYIRGRIREKREGWKFDIGHPILEGILGRTYGVPIFQEQIMRISMEVAGFTAAEADALRRSLVRQRTAEKVEVMGERLRMALLNSGVPRRFADALFKYMQGYAHYGFPESHAASYASLAYKSAYMKKHYPAELVTGLINSQPMGFYSVSTLMLAFEKDGVSFLPVHPNLSDWNAKLEGDKSVRMGFRELSKAREADVYAMMAEREVKAFESVEDFIGRTSFQMDVIRNFAMAGLFEPFGLSRRDAYWKSIEFKRLMEKERSEQLSLFDKNLRLETLTGIFKPLRQIEEMSFDYKIKGYSHQGNMMRALRAEIVNLPKLTSRDIKKFRHGNEVRTCGIVVALQRPPPAKGVAFMTLEDEFGWMDLVFKAEVFEKYRSIIAQTPYLIVDGNVQQRGTGRSLLVSCVEGFASTKLNRSIHPGETPRTLQGVVQPLV